MRDSAKTVFAVLLSLVLVVIGGTSAAEDEADSGNLTYAMHPLFLKMRPTEITNLSMWDGVITVEFRYSLQAKVPWQVRFASENTELMTVGDNDTFQLQPDQGIAADILTQISTFGGSQNVTLHGHFLGFTKLYIFVNNESLADSNVTTWRQLPVEYKVTVYRPERAVDIVFRVAVSVLVVISTMMMGTKIDLNVVKDVLKRPYSPMIGFCTQFLIMPPLAFGLAKLLKLDPSQSLGLFAAGCAPGGGSSNTYTYLLGGCLSLSITMTLVSTIASLGMIPLWLFTLGQLIISDIPNMAVPYENICISLVMILVPAAVGIILQKKAPRISKKLGKGIKPFLIVLVLFMSSFGVWVNLYMFKLFTPKLIGAGILLPWTGFALGALIPLVLRRPKNRILTIAIETGIQNTGVPILLITFSMSSPQGDMAIVAPIVASMFTPLPLLIAVAVLEIRKRCCKKKIDDNEDDNDDDSKDEEKGEKGAHVNKAVTIDDESDVANIKDAEIELEYQREENEKNVDKATAAVNGDINENVETENGAKDEFEAEESSNM
ncbi:ileal sodium/bile acid cotransporter-like [Tubulanus polymorphus]|uniref:ileal sodium/bile acid cotransporter-like n=1 Tax=Tubulanus polymorphus TaxID=672921 RepID=UPI003DA5C284